MSACDQSCGTEETAAQVMARPEVTSVAISCGESTRLILTGAEVIVPWLVVRNWSVTSSISLPWF